MRLYARLLHEVSEINKGLPVHKQLSLQQRREFISQKIYPLYKDVPGYKFRITQVRETIGRKIKRVPKRDNIDVALVPENLYDEIDYFSLDGFLGHVLQDWSIHVKVVAGSFGETKIFNTKQYDYQTSGVADITNAINTFVRNRKRQGRSGEFFYTGFIQVMPGRKNDGDPESYYIELVLQQGSRSAKKIEPVQLPADKKKDKKKRNLKKKKKAKELLQKRIKQIKFARSKVKRVRLNLLKELKDFKSLVKKKYISANEKKTYAKRAYNLEKAKLDKHLKSGTLNDRKYRELLAKIKKGYGQK